nr:cytochrome P450 2C29-like [Dermacentor andersoni]
MLVYSLKDWWWTATVLVIAISYFLGCFYYNVSKYPRGSLPWPVVGNLLTLRKVNNLAIKAGEWSKVYGEVFTLWMAHKPTVVLNTYKAIRETLLERRHEFAGRIPTNLGSTLSASLSRSCA